MSVLGFPRVYFNGYMEWDVCTANNNDYVEMYAQADAALNWDFLAKQDPPITRENFKQLFMPWVIKPHDDSCPNFTASGSTSTTPDSCCSSYKKHMTSRWNYYGSGGCQTVQYQSNVTVTTGGVIGYGQPLDPDPFIGQAVTILGNAKSNYQPSARLVDVNPGCPWSSQIFFEQLYIGDPTSDLYIGGVPHVRMHSRAFYAPRSLDPNLFIAGAVGVLFQCTIPNDALIYSNGQSSPLLQALIHAATDSGGLMIRFTAYSTQYYQNGIFNSNQAFADCDALYQGYQSGYTGSNPAYSRITGTIGAWNKGELSTAPGGHFLTPQTVIPTPTSTAAIKVTEPVGHAARVLATNGGGPPPFPFGAIFAELNKQYNLVSLDLSNAILEQTADAQRYDYGPITVGVQNGSFQPIGTIQSAQYLQSGFFATSGLVDVELSVAFDQVEDLLKDGLLGLQVTAGGKTLLASKEQALVAETDDRGVYVDQCRIAEISVQVRHKNKLPPDGTSVYLAQYFPWLLKLGSSWWQRFGTTPTDPSDPAKICNVLPSSEYVSFIGTGSDGAVPVTDGYAKFQIAAQAPGFPAIAFFPFLQGDSVPVPPDSITFGFTNKDTPQLGTAYFSSARVMPFDNDLPQKFVDLWNSKYDKDAAWYFVYHEILYLYDMLFPIMQSIVNLGDQKEVEKHIRRILELTAAGNVQRNTLYMPVTRDLSAGKRLVIEAYGGLVIAGFPQQPLGPINVPCDQ